MNRSYNIYNIQIFIKLVWPDILNTAPMSCRALYNRLEFREKDVSPDKTEVKQGKFV